LTFCEWQRLSLSSALSQVAYSYIKNFLFVVTYTANKLERFLLELPNLWKKWPKMPLD
jgi:hypothetical protein